MWRKAYILLTVAALLLGGCGPRVTYKYQIAVIPKGLTHEFWQSIHRGAERAAQDLAAQGISVKILWDGPRKESDSAEQINLVQTKSGMGIHGLVLAPQDSKAMVPCVEETVDKGIPVVIIDSGLDPEALKRRPDLMVKYVATNNFNGGKMAAQRLVAVLDKSGPKTDEINVVLFRYQVGSESTEQREAGFLAGIEEENKNRAKKGQALVKVISDDKYAGATVDSAVNEANPLLIQVKDKAHGIFAVNESACNGMLNAMRSQGLNKKIRLVGFDSSEPLLQAVKEGDVDGLIVQDPYRMGYLGVWTLVQHLEGVDVKVGGPNLSTGEYLLTKENMDAPESRQLFDRNMQAQRMIQTPEFKKK